MRNLSIIICLACLVLAFESCENIFEKIGINDKPFLDSLRNTNLIYDLDRKEYPTIDTLTTVIGENFKNEFLQTKEDDYIFVGANPDSNVLILFLDILGQEYLRINNQGRGAAHAICQTLNPQIYAVVGERDNELFYTWVSIDGNLSNTRSYASLFNSRLGAIEYIKGYDIIQTKDGGNLITGVVKQTIGEDRLFMLKIDNSGGAIWLNTFFDDAIGTSITEDNDGNFYASGYRKSTGNTILVKVKNEGNQGIAEYLIPYPESSFSSFNTIYFKNGSLFLVDSRSRAGSTYMRLMNLDLEGNNLLFENGSNGILFGNQDNQKGYSIFPTVGYEEGKRDMDNGFILLGLDEQNDDNKTFFLKQVSFDGQENSNFQSSDFSSARISYDYKGSRYEIAGNIIQTNDYGFAAIGLSSNDGKNYRLHLLKTDAVGAKRSWQ
jgi:hypothetical protein